MSAKAYLNDISLAVPEHDIHQKFVDFVPSLLQDPRHRKLFSRMVERCQINHRYSCVNPDVANDQRWSGLYTSNSFPSTDKRMKSYQENAFSLAQKALDPLLLKRGEEITHLIITTCTGFYAPGIDHEIINHYGLSPSIERTVIGFMGCYAGMNALKSARHVVRSDKNAKVLVVNLELCTLHLQETDDLEKILSFLIFADGCSASIISADPVGIELQSFYSTVVPESADQITWAIGESGFDMRLAGEVPATIAARLPEILPHILQENSVSDIDHWAIHPGGRTILDAVRAGLGIEEDSLRHSRKVLRNFGNMSSATIMFVLKSIMEQKIPGRGCGMAFGPGLTVESMLFRHAA